MASQYRRRSLMLNTIAKVAQGNPTIITDSSSRRLKRLDIYGQSEQANTTGAQLLDPSLFESNDITKNGIHFIKNSDGSISVSGTATGFSTYSLRLNELQKGTYYINGTKNNTYVYVLIKKTDSEKYIENASFTIDGTETSIKIFMQINPDFSVNDIIYPMLNLGNTSKPFEPYTGGKPSPNKDYPQEIISKEVSSIIVSNGASESQTITLSDPITLRGIPVSSGGNVTIDGQQYISDVITEKDGVIGVERNAKELIFDGSEDEVVSVDEYLGNVTRTTIVIENSSYNITFSDKFKFINNYDLDEPHFYYWNNVLYLFVPVQLTTSQEFKEWLQTNPVDVVYTLQTPTFEPLPEEVQAQYKALKSYYPNTVIQTGCWNEVTYSAKRGG